MREYTLTAPTAQVTTHLTFGPNTPEQTRSFIENAMFSAEREPRSDYLLAIQLIDGDVIGTCGLNVHKEPVNAHKASIGYVLASQFWNRGYATESCNALCEFAFKGLQLHKVFSKVEPDNQASIKVLEKLGFRREGLLRHDAIVRGEWRNYLLYAVLADEWSERPMDVGPSTYRVQCGSEVFGFVALFPLDIAAG
ncbi:MAG: GNAT family protein [Planctomycetota bacterium]|nr:GNAT family protein [Planctomycetota bacterium]